MMAKTLRDVDFFHRKGVATALSHSQVLLPQGRIRDGVWASGWFVGGDIDGSAVGCTKSAGASKWTY